MMRSTDTRPRRRGGLTPFALAAFVVLLAALALAVDYTFLWRARVELQVSADAAALAAVQTLVDDDLLLGDPAAARGLAARAADEARRYALLNPVAGRPLELRPDPLNRAGGDLLFGAVDSPRSRLFVRAEGLDDPANTFLTLLNAVRVTARRTRAGGTPLAAPLGGFLLDPAFDGLAAATAMLDRDVVGFRPVGARPLPLVPLALRSDPGAADPLSWEYQVAARNGSDLLRFDRAAKAFVDDPGGDGLHEMEVTLGLPAQPLGSVNACVLAVGARSFFDVGRQVRAGVTPDDLLAFGGEFVLDATNHLALDGSPYGPDGGTPEFDDLRASLEQLSRTAEQRVFPLYVRCDAAARRAVLAGFVAARVARVRPAAAGPPLAFTLQPTLVSVPAAVTDAARRGAGGVNIVNPYVVKVRLVE
jgi:hypothetical protein